MDWLEALEVVIARTKHERYRELCAGDHPDHVVWRNMIVEQATGQPLPERVYPAVSVQVANLFRSVRVWVKSGFKLAPRAIRLQRQAECDICEHFDRVQRRCVKCGCFNSAKVAMASDQCPLGRWLAVRHDQV